MPNTGLPEGLAVGAELAPVLFGGVAPASIYRQSGNVVANQTITINGEVIRVAVVNTDSTNNTSGGELNNTTPEVTLTMAAHGLKGGDLIRVENEIMLVKQVLNANQVRLTRGVSNTTIATHADGLDIFTEATPGNGGLAVGVVATLTPAVFSPALVADVNARSVNPVKAVRIDDNATLFIMCDKRNGTPIASSASWTTAETMTNGAWDGNITGGRRPEVVVPMKIVPAAGDVTAGYIKKVFPFTPVVEDITVRVTSTGAAKAWDGAATVSGNILTIDNAGSTDWAATDTITVWVRPS